MFLSFTHFCRFEGDLKVFLNQIYKKSDSSESEEPSEAAFNKKDLLCLAIQSPQELVNCLLDEAISSGQKGSNSSAAVILEILTILEKIVLRKTEGEFHIIHEIVSR